MNTRVCKYLFAKILLSIFKGIYLEAELLGQMIILFLIFEEPLYCFQQQLHHFQLPLIVHKVSIFLYHHQYFLLFCFLK